MEENIVDKELVRGVTHDIRNCITSIAGCSETALDYFNLYKNGIVKYTSIMKKGIGNLIGKLDAYINMSGGVIPGNRFAYDVIDNQWIDIVGAVSLVAEIGCLDKKVTPHLEDMLERSSKVVNEFFEHQNDAIFLDHSLQELIDGVDSVMNPVVSGLRDAGKNSDYALDTITEKIERVERFLGYYYSLLTDDTSKERFEKLRLNGIIGGIKAAYESATELLDSTYNQGVLKNLETIEKGNSMSSDILGTYHTLIEEGASKKEAMDLGGPLKKYSDFVANTSKKKMNIIYEIEDDLNPVLANETQIGRIICNLMVNALHVSPDRGDIKVGAGNRGNEAMFYVQDYGTGIPEKILGKVLEPDFTTKEKGTGLGLSNSNEILKNHHGRIEIKSKVGEGTRVEGYIPLHKE